MRKVSNKNLYERVAQRDHCNLLTGYHHVKRMEIALSFLKGVIQNMKEAAKILDIGCGDGLFDDLMSRHFQLAVKIVGIDISLTKVKRARDRVSGVSFVVADIYHLPFRGIFDIVIMGEIIEHLHTPRVALKNVHGVLKQKGHLILDTLSKTNIIDMFLRLIGHEPTWGLKIDRTHVTFYDEQSLTDLLHSAGFNITDIRGDSFLRYDLLSLLSITWNRNRWWLPRLIDAIAERYTMLRSKGAIQVFSCQKATFK